MRRNLISIFVLFFLTFFLIGSAVILTHPETALAQEGWEDKDWPTSEGYYSEGYYNVFLKTDDIIKKAGIFFGLVLTFYVLFYLFFKALIKNNRSPASAFTVCFSFPTFIFYIIAVICFSEYLIENHNKGLSYVDYLSLFNWLYVLLGFVVWIIISATITSILKGTPKNL